MGISLVSISFNSRAVCWWTGAIAILGVCLGPLAAANDEVAIRHFESRVRPVLIERCYKCHTGRRAKGGLRLDSAASLRRGGEAGAAVVPTKPEESLLIQAVRHQGGLNMPPKEKLSDQQVADLVRWVEMGAIWPDELSHWAYRPVRDVAPPVARQQRWVKSPVDSFLLAKLEERNLTPGQPADKRTLLRRATFDLTGLPPQPEEIETFLADESPTAFAKVVDRLLASPLYGQRWGRHWLDVVRYADARDLIQLPPESDFREAWRYRDWVVDAFNRDLPYDEFTTRQLAGDLLQPADPTKIDKEALVATGMLAIADFVPGDVDKEQMIADYVNDQIDVVGRAFLGLTLACARCHDHKFDPILTEDYYALAGIFFSTRVIPGPVKGNTPLVKVPLLSPGELQAAAAQAARDKAHLAGLSQRIITLTDEGFLAYQERRLMEETRRYLPASWEFLHPPAGEHRPPLGGFAAAGMLDASALARWIKYLEKDHPHPAIAALLAAPNRAAGERMAQELGKKLSVIAADRRARTARDPVTRTLAGSEILRFRADDQRIVTDEARHVMLWPNRRGIAADAMPVPDTPAPVLATTTIRGQTRPVLRFSGKELLQTPRSVLPIGSLFVVFRTDRGSVAGQRLVGWEDSSAGQHGVGLMSDATGAVRAVLRRNGASGDVAAHDLAVSDFQVLDITWGPAGVVVCRDGEVIGTNKEIDSVSSDPAIAALKIGGPGSGSSPRFHGDLAELRVYAVQVDDQARARIEAELKERWSASARHRVAGGPVVDLYDELVSPQGPLHVHAAERETLLSDDVRTRLASLRAELETLKQKLPLEIPRAVVVLEGGPPGTKHQGFHDAQVYIRGNPANPGKTVHRGFPKFLAGANQPPIRKGSGRRELARWLTRPDHPLTARVMVNRLWQHHFGSGLVRTSTNFGVMGERPSHPELLDYLAGRFVSSGWSVKAMHRLIMLSSAYQQSTQVNAAALAVDPENRLLWRMNRRRLEAEAIRDSLLAVSARLDATLGGPGKTDVSTPRRSLYLMSVRTGAKTADFGPLFDAPDCSAIVERRNESIVAPQALFLLNDRFMIELAAELGERVSREISQGTQRERIRRLYEITLGRRPTADETRIGLQFLADPARVNAWDRYCHLLICTNEFIYVD
jgi:hypothetical protein